MRVLSAGVDLQLLDDLPRQLVVREHALDGHLDRLLGARAQQLLVADLLEAARVARVAVRDLGLPLVAGQRHLAGVDDHHVVAGVDVRGERRLVLATQEGRGVSSQAAQDDVRSVDNVPLTLDLTRLRAVRTHRITLSRRRSWVARWSASSANFEPT